VFSEGIIKAAWVFTKASSKAAGGSSLINGLFSKETTIFIGVVIIN